MVERFIINVVRKIVEKLSRNRESDNGLLSNNTHEINNLHVDNSVKDNFM